jgi:hypothetical protein
VGTTRSDGESHGQAREEKDPHTRKKILTKRNGLPVGGSEAGTQEMQKCRNAGMQKCRNAEMQCSNAGKLRTKSQCRKIELNTTAAISIGTLPPEYQMGHSFENIKKRHYR